MLPLRDDTPSCRVPWVVVILLVANTLVMLVASVPGIDASSAVSHFGMVPWRFFHWHLTGHSPYDPLRFVPVLSSMFLHDGWLHLVTNMLYLWVFGRALETRLGGVGVAATFFLSGVAAALGQLLAHPASSAAMIGASGAIAGVLGAYLVCFPRAQLTIAFPFFYVPWLFRVRAWVFLLVWFAFQIGKGSLDLMQHTSEPAVAWWAHAAGFVAGVTGALADRFWSGAAVPPRVSIVPRNTFVPAG